MNSGPQIALMEPVILQWCFEIALEGINDRNMRGDAKHRDGQAHHGLLAHVAPRRKCVCNFYAPGCDVSFWQRS